MAEFRIKVDLSDVISAKGIITAEIFPLLNQAVRMVAEQTSINWTESVERAKLWRGEKDAYKATIQWQMVSDFEALVWADYKYAEEIETGRPQKDLKRMLNTSLKVRMSKKGSRYLIIPFQHNTPGSNATGQAMPDEIDIQHRPKSCAIVNYRARKAVIRHGRLRYQIQKTADRESEYLQMGRQA